ncbi:MAG: ATP-binding protein [Bacteroidia bacterium]
MAIDKKHVKINDRSIESAGITKDYKEAIAELIWNGFDAGATRIEIEFDANEIEHVDQIRVRDNGSGISHKTLPRTFGTLLDSIKNVSYQRSSYIHGQKGKGRFSFTTFARHATWNTVTNPDGQPMEYSITIHSRGKDVYETTEPKPIPTTAPTGTEVILTNLFGVTSSSFTNDAFMEFLCQEFGWFLFLNRKNQYTLSINGEELNYSRIIAEYDVFAVILDDEAEGKSYSFDITFIRWKTRIGDRYYYYFLNQQKREAAKQLTSFNNNPVDFHHSVYVESSFFDDFGVDADDPGSRLLGKNQSHSIFKSLLKEMHDFVDEKEEQFIQQEAAFRLLREYQVLGVIPTFGQNAYDQARFKELEALLHELYTSEPKLFRGLKREQQRIFVSLLEMGLRHPSRMELIGAIQHAVPLKERDKDRLKAILAPSEISEVSQSINQIANRHTRVANLQYFLEDASRFAAERASLRDVLTSSLWLIDEGLTQAVSNPERDIILQEAAPLLDGSKKAGEAAAREGMLVTKRLLVPDLGAESMVREDVILVEAKAPGKKLGQADHRLAQAYLRSVMKHPHLNNENLRWRLYMIADGTEPYMREQRKNAQSKGKAFLIQQHRSFDIFVCTWRELFTLFTEQQRFTLTGQSLKRNDLELALLSKGVTL